MNLTNYFQRIYIINLRHRKDRRREMAQELRKIGLSFRSPEVRLFEAVRPETQGDFPSVGARGAFLSHLGILKEARDQKVERILVFEDDLNFVPEFSESVGAVIKELEREDWKIFYGGYVLQMSLPSGGHNAVTRVEPTLEIQTAHFVGLRGEAISEAVDYLEAMLARSGGDPRGGPMHVDGAYSWFRRAFPQMLTVLATPQIGYQRSSRSDIYDLRWFDRVPGVLHVMAALRQVKNHARESVSALQDR
jgi:glycosyl transferase, family 25